MDKGQQSLVLLFIADLRMSPVDACLRTLYSSSKQTDLSLKVRRWHRSHAQYSHEVLGDTESQPRSSTATGSGRWFHATFKVL